MGRSENPEDQVDLEDSLLLKDARILIFFKNQVAFELYHTEEEEIKEAVRSRRDAEVLAKTVYNTTGEERMELVQEYQRSATGFMQRTLN